MVRVIYIVTLSFFFAIGGYAQVMQTTGPAGGLKLKAAKADTMLIAPFGSDTTNIGWTKWGVSTTGALFVKTADSSLWYRINNKWHKLSGTGGGGVPIDSVAIRWNSAASTIYTFNGKAGGTVPNDRSVLIGQNTGGWQRSKGLVAVGYNTLTAIDTRDSGYHIAIGTGALGSYKGVSFTSNILSNVAIGYDALKLDTAGQQNVAIGTRALSNMVNVGGSTQNVAIGHEALLNYNGSGVGKNLAIGRLAGSNTTTGTGNVFIGASAVGPAASRDLTVIGTLATVASGERAVAIGYAANAVQYTTSIGNYTGYLSAGQNSVFIGNGGNFAAPNATAYNVDGNNQVIIGAYAANGGTATTGAGNTIIGYSAAQSMNGAAGYNLVLGANVGLISNTGSNQLAVGGAASNSRWLISDVSGSHRRWTLNGTTTDVSANTTSVTLDITGTLGGVRFPRLTTTERGALTAVEGLVIFNTTTKKLQVYDNTAWVDLH